ncbi:hypothetical protein [Flavobacterium succinicans]|uniref:DUF4424 domain-containing protein n=1 Tax=Flavobacterium succinicans TaxID=29536 RepID=A0A199XPM0_9FLAO|nr:hypothetical protein [Flavobacterium succinicans]OAZ03595.1 hypothetical protein FLB_18710 [Flavobacterium succinicans]
MKRILLLIFYFPLLAAAQLQIKINTITTDNSNKNHRKFNIEYTLENTSDKEIAFFFTPNHFNSAHRGSLQTAMLFKIFENDTLIPTDGILSNSKNNYSKLSNILDVEEKMKTLDKMKADELNITIDSLRSYRKRITSDPDFFQKESSKKLMSSIIRLPSKSSKTYHQDLYWNKKRYFKTDDNEYYLGEASPFFIELSLVALKEELSFKLSSEDFKIIKNDTSFIKGYFTSNKTLIDLSK